VAPTPSFTIARLVRILDPDPVFLKMVICNICAILRANRGRV